MNNKILSTEELIKVVEKLKKENKKIVFTNGCFDLLHIGHVSLFQKARTLGDVLIVAINSDSSLAQLKGPKRPLVPQTDRTQLLSALTCVDYVVVFNEQTPYELLSKLKPDILVKGGDYKIEDIVGKEFVKEVYRYPLVEGKSTTNLIKLIIERYSNFNG
jgi:rfaE bifunctional protein nucleotidyltransferase chain/domain